jgi:hypothetical protein
LGGEDLLWGRDAVKLKACLAAGLLGLTFGPVSAEPVRSVSSGEVLTPPQVSGIVRSMGFVPTGTPARNGPTYAVRAVGQRGRPVRVVVDARSGNVLSIRPIAALGVAPYPVPPGRIPWFGLQLRPPAAIGRSEAYSPPPLPRARAAPDAAKPSQQSAAGSEPLPVEPSQQSAPSPEPPPANPNVLTIRPAAPSANPAPPVSAKGPTFPPAQTLE